MSDQMKVMVFGTFDGLHPGHLNFLKQAGQHGDKLIVVVARDTNVKKIKGRWPRFKEKKRLDQVKRIKVADQVILGQIKDPYAVIKVEKPNIICLGYDQNSFAQGLPKKFPAIKIIRLKPYKPNIYKSSKLN
jgi:FAD synthetase